MSTDVAPYKPTRESNIVPTIYVKQLQDSIDALQTKIDALTDLHWQLHNLLFTTTDPREPSLQTRVQHLESNMTTDYKGKTKWETRLWQLFLAVLVFVSGLLADEFLSQSHTASVNRAYQRGVDDTVNQAKVIQKADSNTAKSN